jgi:hypothetical protein
MLISENKSANGKAQWVRHSNLLKRLLDAILRKGHEREWDND